MVAIGLLQKLGCRVDVSANGREAVELWRHLPYDVILMDCNMPEMDGYQAAAEIRRQEFSNQHIPIVAITANAMQGDRERCLEAGMDDYMSKPIDPQKLETVLARFLLTEQDPFAPSAAITACVVSYSSRGLNKETQEGPEPLRKLTRALQVASSWRWIASKFGSRFGDRGGELEGSKSLYLALGVPAK